MKKFICIICMLLCTAANGFAAVSFTEENPIAYDKEKKTVSFLAEVNGKYFYQPTRHLAIYEKGKFGDKGRSGGQIFA